MFKQVVDYIASYDPEFPKHIKGATPAQIDELSCLMTESLYPEKLPPAYKDFLLTMGLSMDWINIDDSDFSISTVIDFYKKNNWLEPDDLIFIAKGPVDSSLYLEIMSTNYHSDAGGEIYRLGDYSNDNDFTKARSDFIDRRANTLVGLICFYVFDKFEIKAKNRVYQHYYSRHIWLREIDVLSGLDSLLKQHGFEKLWFSDHSRAYQRKDVAIKMTTNKNVSYNYCVSADNKQLEQIYCLLISKYFKEFDGPLDSEDEE